MALVLQWCIELLICAKLASPTPSQPPPVFHRDAPFPDPLSNHIQTPIASALPVLLPQLTPSLFTVALTNTPNSRAQPSLPASHFVESPFHYLNDKTADRAN